MEGKPYEPTQEERRLVRAFAGFGIPQEEVARHLNIDPKTLRKHYREELDRGITEANAKVAQSLFQMATSGKNVAAAIFWMKARGGWREKHEVEHSTAGGRPLAIITGVPRAEMSDQELQRIASRGLDDDDDDVYGHYDGRRRTYVERPMTEEEWAAKYCRAAKPD